MRKTGVRMLNAITDGGYPEIPEEIINQSGVYSPSHDEKHSAEDWVAILSGWDEDFGHRILEMRQACIDGNVKEYRRLAAQFAAIGFRMLQHIEDESKFDGSYGNDKPVSKAIFTIKVANKRHKYDRQY